MGKRSGGSGCDVTCFPVLAQIKRAIHIALLIYYTTATRRYYEFNQYITIWIISLCEEV